MEGLTPLIIQVCKMMSRQSKNLKIADPKIKKTKTEKWRERGLHVSYRVENLHATYFFMFHGAYHSLKFPNYPKSMILIIF